MSGYNLPPGVSERDLPGFRDEEVIEIDVICPCGYEGVTTMFEGEIETNCPECGGEMLRA